METERQELVLYVFDHRIIRGFVDEARTVGAHHVKLACTADRMEMCLGIVSDT